MKSLEDSMLSKYGTYYVTVLWGEFPMEGDTPDTYKFCTEAERNAFTLGLDEACGWHGHDYRIHDKPKKFKLTDFYNYEEEEVSDATK
jgi:hypothetical protein